MSDRAAGEQCGQPPVDWIDRQIRIAGEPIWLNEND